MASNAFLGRVTSIQYYLSGRDISGEPCAKADADTVRLWADDTCLVSVRDQANGEHFQRWKYDGSDIGHLFSVELMETEFESWDDAIDAFSRAYADLAEAEAWKSEPTPDDAPLAEWEIALLAESQPTCCDGTGWTGNPSAPCAEHFRSSYDYE